LLLNENKISYKSYNQNSKKKSSPKKTRGTSLQGTHNLTYGGKEEYLQRLIRCSWDRLSSRCFKALFSRSNMIFCWPRKSISAVTSIPSVCKDWTLLSSSAIYWSFRTRDLWAYCLQLTWKLKKLNRCSSFKVYQHQSSWTLDMEHASPFDGGIIQVCIYWQQREVQCTWRCAPIMCSRTS